MNEIVNANAEVVTTEPTVNVASAIENLIATPPLAADTTPVIQTPDATPATPKVRKARTPRVYDLVKMADTTDGKVNVVMPDGTVAGTFDDVKSAWMKSLEIKAASKTKIKIIREKIEGVVHHRGRAKMTAIQMVDAPDKKIAVLDIDGTEVGQFDDCKSAYAKSCEIKATYVAAGTKVTIKRVRSEKRTVSTELLTSTDENSLNQIKVVLEKIGQNTSVVKTDAGFSLVPSLHLKRNDFRNFSAIARGAQLALTNG
jgi:Holliday junction resolvase